MMYTRKRKGRIFFFFTASHQMDANGTQPPSSTPFILAGGGTIRGHLLELPLALVWHLFFLFLAEKGGPLIDSHYYFLPPPLVSRDGQTEVESP